MLFMISQKMGGFSDEEILATRDRLRDELLAEGHEVLDTYYEAELPPDVKNSGLYWLGLSLMDMSKCDAVYFSDGWYDARGCRIEHDAATEYGLQMRYEES